MLLLDGLHHDIFKDITFSIIHFHLCIFQILFVQSDLHCYHFYQGIHDDVKSRSLRRKKKTFYVNQKRRRFNDFFAFITYNVILWLDRARGSASNAWFDIPASGVWQQTAG